MKGKAVKTSWEFSPINRGLVALDNLAFIPSTPTWQSPRSNNKVHVTAGGVTSQSVCRKLVFNPVIRDLTSSGIALSGSVSPSHPAATVGSDPATAAKHPSDCTGCDLCAKKADSDKHTQMWGRLTVPDVDTPRKASVRCLGMRRRQTADTCGKQVTRSVREKRAKSKKSAGIIIRKLRSLRNLLRSKRSRSVWTNQKATTADLIASCSHRK